MEDKIPNNTGNNITEDKPKVSSALVVGTKKPDDLIEEDIDSQILSILGLEDVFDLTYEEYASLLKEAAVKGRMPSSQMTTESVELVTNELKRVKNKTGRFKVKPKKVDIDKVFNRKTPTPTGAIVKAQKLVPPIAEEAPEQEKKLAGSTDQENLLKGIGNILESLITIRGLLQSEGKTEQKAAQEDRKEIQKKKKKEKESKLEAKKPTSPILKALTKPVDDFFGAIKRFFTNVLLGSVVLGMFKWLKDPANQKAVDGFSNFLQKNAGLILGGLLAIALLPIAPMLLSLTGTILGGLGTLTKALGGLGGLLLKIPGLGAAAGAAAPIAGAIAASGAAAVGVTLAMKGTYDLIRGQIAGGGDFAKVDEQLRNKLAGYGITETGMTYKKGSRKQQKLSASQQKVYEEIQGKRNELKKLKEERDTKIRNIELDPKYYTQKSPRSARVLSEEGKKKIQEIRESYNQKALKVFEPEQPSVQPQTPAVPGAPPSQKGLPTLPPTNTLPGKQHYGAQRKGGRKHTGVDFDAGPNDSFYSRIGGEVTNIGNDPDGYYKYVDIYNPELNVTERIAEGDNILVRKGQKVSPGTAVAKGTNTTGVFHYEIRKGKATTFGFAGTLDPIAFLGNPTTQSQTAQVAQTPPSIPSIPSPTGRSNITPIPIPTGGGTPQVSSGTSPNQAPVPRFSSEDPNNTTTMVVRAIYNIVG